MMLENENFFSYATFFHVPKVGDPVNDILCGWGIAIIYGDLPFTVHVCTGLSTLGEKRKTARIN